MISIKTKEEIEIMARGGKILAQIMRELKTRVRPGVRSKELDGVAKDLILKFGGRPSFLGYQDFPAALCTSINEQVVHGVPSDRVLTKGDIVSLDIGIFYRGFHTDMAFTLPVGEVSKEAQKLIKVTKKALKIGIRMAKIGNRFGDLSNAIQEYVEGQGFNVVRELAGHGIGRELHQDPQVLNYGKKRTGPKIKRGMTFCIEPMVTIGDWHIEKTNHAFSTKDGSLSCHFEHTIAIAENGPELLTELKSSLAGVNAYIF